MPLKDRLPGWLRHAMAVALILLAVATLWGVGPFDGGSGYISTALFLLGGFLLSQANQPVPVNQQQKDSPEVEIISYMLIVVSMLGAVILGFSSGIFEGRLEWNFGTKLGLSLVVLSILANLVISGRGSRG